MSNSIGYDSDEEPPTEMAVCLWTLPPDESLSDWTIEIVTIDDDAASDNEDDIAPPSAVDTYHVHKATLAAGARKSEYFRRLFGNHGRFSEGVTNTSRIEFPALAARVFPCILNYLYDERSELQISSETAVALHHLGSYFEIRNLKWDSKKFCEMDLDSENCGTYYEHAFMFHDEKMIEVAQDMCRTSILTLQPDDTRLVHIPDLDFWFHLLENAYVTNEFSLHISKLIANMCDNVDVSPATFQNLTRKEYLPIIHFDGALKLIGHEQRILSPSVDSLSCLQKRCVQGLSLSPENLTLNTHTQWLTEQNPRLLTELLKLSLTKSDRKLNQLQTELNKFHSVKESRYCVAEDPTEPMPMLQWESSSVDETYASFEEYDNGIVRNYPLFYFKAN